MNFKKISISFLSILALSSFLFNTGYAQSSQGTTVATVSISNAKIVSQADRDFTLSFDISNKVGAQPDIKYGVQLFQITSTKSTKVDEKVYDESLSLGANTTINKTINYTISNSIPAGNYKIYIVSKNSSGLPLSISLAGQATIGKSTSDSIQIVKDSCYVVTSTSSKVTQYPIDLGFSIAPKDQLILKCKVTSTLANTTFKTNFVTKSGSAYGDVVSIDSSSTESVLIKKGTNNISINLPIASKPQSYNLSVSLESSKAVSNALSINYNLMGQTGVIQNIVFDKTYYGKGDKANVQIYSTQYGTGTISIIVTDENNEICSATTTQNVSSFSVINLPIKITKDCNNPKANVILSVGDKVLDSKDFNITSNEADRIAVFKKDMITKIIVIVIAIIVVLLIGLFVKRSKKSAVMMLLMLAIAGFGFSVSAETCDTGLLNYNVDITDSKYECQSTATIGSTVYCTDYSVYFDLGKNVSISSAYYTGSEDYGSYIQEVERSIDINNFFYADTLSSNEWLPLDGNPHRYVKISHRYIIDNPYNAKLKLSGNYTWSIRVVGYYNDVYNCDTFQPQITSFFASPNPALSEKGTTLYWTTNISDTSNSYITSGTTEGIDSVSCTLSGGNLGTIVGLNGNSSYKISTITKDETFGLSCSFALDSNATYEYLSKINITPVPPYTKANVKVIEKDNLDNLYLLHYTDVMKLNSDGSIASSKFVDSDGFINDFKIDSSNIYLLIAKSSASNCTSRCSARVEKYNLTGNKILEFNLASSTYALAIDTDSSGNVYVLSDYNKIIKFDSSGNFIKNIIPGLPDMKDMVVDSNGYIYVLVDDFFYGPSSNPVQRYVIKLNNDGGLVKGIGTQSITTNNGYNIISSLGTGDGQFIYPASISIDSFDNLYVLDPGNNRVQKFDSSGNFLTKFDVLLSDVSCNTSSYSCSGGGLSNEILIDSSGKIYVTDYGKEQIQIFDKIGSTMNVDSSLITVNAINPISIDISANPNKIKEGVYSTVSWSSEGADSCSLTQNGSPWINSNYNPEEYEYVSQFGNSALSTTYYVSSGSYTTSGTSDSNLAFYHPLDLKVDSSNNLYVTDESRVRKFDLNGNYISELDDNYFSNPVGITFDSDKNVYVYSQYNYSYAIVKFNSSGTHINDFTINYSSGGPNNYRLQEISIDSSKNILSSQFNFTTSGGTYTTYSNTDFGNFTKNYANIFTDSFGNIYVTSPYSSGGNTTDDYWNVVRKYDKTGKLTLTFGGSGTGNGKFNNPKGIAVDSLGNIYVVDSGNNRVQKFDSSGNFITKFGSYGTGDGQFNSPQGIALDSSGNIYIADGNNNRVQKFSKKSSFTSGSKAIQIATTTEIGIECMNDHNSTYASTTIGFEPKGICPIHENGACKPGKNIEWIELWSEACTEAGCSVDYNDSAMIHWGAENADSCSLFKGDSSEPLITSNETSGSITSGKLTAETSFTLKCQKEDEELSTSLSISVKDKEEEPGEQEQNNFGVKLSCDAKQGTSTDYYINRNTTWEVKVNNPKGAKLDKRSWNGTSVSSNSTGNTLNKIYTTVGNKTMNIVDVYSLNGATSSAKCSKTIKLKLDSGTNTEI